MRLRALAALAVTAVAAACGGSDGGTPITPPTTSKDTIFTIGMATFSPNQLTISRGSTVVFALGFDGIGHDVLFDAAAGAPAYIPVVARQNVPRTFNVAGNFPYHCPAHPEMTGAITVQ
jgi:plastocyanin